ncbi:unnamed protein product [Brassica rapa subsp. narinosa]
MVLCGSRDGYWLFQDSYGLPRGVDDIIKVRKGRLTVSKVRRDKTSASGGKQYVDSKKLKEISEYFHGDSVKVEAQVLRVFVVVRDFLFILDEVCKEIDAS